MRDVEHVILVLCRLHIAFFFGLESAFQVLFYLRSVKVPATTCLLSTTRDLEVIVDKVMVTTGKQEIIVRVATTGEFGEVVVGYAGLALGGRVDVGVLGLVGRTCVMLGQIGL